MALCGIEVPDEQAIHHPDHVQPGHQHGLCQIRLDSEHPGDGGCDRDVAIYGGRLDRTQAGATGIKGQRVVPGLGAGDYQTKLSMAP